MATTDEETILLPLKLKFRTAKWIGEGGLVAVFDGENEFHVHTDGRPAYSERFRMVGRFVNGFAWVRAHGQGKQREYHITKDGQPAYKKRFERVGNFDECGRARASLDLHDGASDFYIDVDGNNIGAAPPLKATVV